MVIGWIREMYAWDVGVLLTGAKMMVTEVWVRGQGHGPLPQEGT